MCAFPECKSFHKLINEQKNADLKSIQKLFYWGCGGVELIKMRRGQSRLTLYAKKFENLEEMDTF